jgi:hypothetical protein
MLYWALQRRRRNKYAGGGDGHVSQCAVQCKEQEQRAREHRYRYGCILTFLSIPWLSLEHALSSCHLGTKHKMYPGMNLEATKLKF